MNWEKIDWTALERLRRAFLEGTAGQRDYWQSESDLASYDQTFAQRIGWKWDYVLEELKRRGWAPPRGALLDWGCGSGIAGRAFVDHFGVCSATSLHLLDRSPLAINYAAQRARDKFPSLPVATTRPEQPAVLLLSHVLTELKPEQTEELLRLVGQASATIWVEPGTYEASLTLIAVRERLRGDFHLVAPCPHRERCGILAAGNERHWCHHFAPPPPEVFTDSNWTRFAQLVGIDLRSLPMSFLVLDRRAAPVLPAGAIRVIGRPRLYKAHALLLSCAAAGVRDLRLNKRTLPKEFRRLKKGQAATLQVCQTDGDDLLEIQASL